MKRQEYKEPCPECKSMISGHCKHCDRSASFLRYAEESVETEVHKGGLLFLHQQLASGTHERLGKFSIDCDMSGNIHVGINRYTDKGNHNESGRVVVFKAQELANVAFKIYEKELEKEIVKQI